MPQLDLHVISVAPGRAVTTLAHLRSDPAVRAATPDDVRQVAGTVSDPAYAKQWALKKIGWDSAFATVKVRGVRSQSPSSTPASTAATPISRGG